MNIKYIAVLLVFGEFCSAKCVPSREHTNDTVKSTIEYFRQVYQQFPCANKTIVDQVFNTVSFVLNPREANESKMQSAKMDWLYIMVMGHSTNLSKDLWYEIMNKTMDNYGNEAMDKHQLCTTYFSPQQYSRFKLYLQQKQANTISADGEIFNRYYFGFPIGLALGVPEDDITEVLEDDTYGDDAINYLGRLAHMICDNKHPELVNHRKNENIARDLKEAIEALMNKVHFE